MQVKIPAVYMRGGTSKGLFFHDKDLPRNPQIRDRIVLAAFGSPDPGRRQLDGMGGATSTTSKVAIISPSEDPSYDVVYEFGQISIDKAIFDHNGNCGNMSAAVGPYVIEQGLVVAKEPITKVRIHQKNTNKLIIAEVPVKNGHYDDEGDYYLDGIPFPSSKITLHYMDPAGSVTGNLFPTGQQVDRIDLPGVGTLDITIMDASNPVVFVAAGDLGINGNEIHEIDADVSLKAKLEKIRGYAAVHMGLVATPEEATESCQAVPKIAVVSPAQDYISLSGKKIAAEEIDLTVRIMSMGTLHKAYAVSGGVCTVGAAAIPGTIVNKALQGKAIDIANVKLGHPGGILTVGAEIEQDDDSWNYISASITRSARRLMDGSVYIPERYFQEKFSYEDLLAEAS